MDGQMIPSVMNDYRYSIPGIRLAGRARATACPPADGQPQDPHPPWATAKRTAILHSDSLSLSGGRLPGGLEGSKPCRSLRSSGRGGPGGGGQPFPSSVPVLLQTDRKGGLLLCCWVVGWAAGSSSTGATRNQSCQPRRINQANLPSIVHDVVTRRALCGGSERWTTPA